MTASQPLDFAPREYKRTQTEELAVAEQTALVPSEDLELGDLVDQVFEKSTGEINNVIEEFERLRGKLKTDGENIKREIEEYGALSQKVMELTKTVAESVEKVRASVYR